MNRIKFFSYFLIMIVGCIGIWQLDVPHDSIPALGRLLNPFTGFWQNAEPLDYKPERELNLTGLEASVEVLYDDRLVPHIYAQNEHDLYFAQGYITASHRLWQMEIQTHSAAGRLSEILGPNLLSRDRMTRRLGLPYAAEVAVDSYDPDSPAFLAMQAYTAGVNEYINSLEPKDYPLEYKILGYAPEEWTPLKTALLLKYMANMLTGNEKDHEITNFVGTFSDTYLEAFYGYHWDIVDPIIPSSINWNTDSIPKMDSSMLGLSTVPGDPMAKPDPLLGSNNWAVAPNKTANGNPILANDPHLRMTLPAIWYEIHLNAPGINTYGVSLPGTPCVIIGFNDDIAWGVTNSSRDVKDWYKINFEDSERQRYMFEGEWADTEFRLEEIKIKGMESYTDTVAYTYWGPVVSHPNLDFSGPKDHALRWTAHDPSNELMTFLKLNKASNHETYIDAISHFECPGQNFVFASKDGDIAIKQQGKFPILRPGQGRQLQIGSTKTNEWQGYIPFDENPHVLNPLRGFVSSANQQPTDSTYPYFYGGIYEHYRNRRINSQLEQMDNITMDDMQRLQLDNFNWQASDALPLMLAHLSPEMEADEIKMLKDWNYMNEADLQAPALYEMWWDSLHYNIWDEFRAYEVALAYPSIFNTTEMLRRDMENPFMDIISTVEQEDFVDVNSLSFRQALDAFREEGAPDWGTAKATFIEHIGRIPAFGHYNVHCSGNKHIVNATGRTAGPSWRMVVELGETVVPRGIYPGGQSGNPGSPYFDNFIEDWVDGQYYELLFGSEEELSNKAMASQTLKPE